MPPLSPEPAAHLAATLPFYREPPMSRTRKVKGKIIVARRAAVLFQAGEKKTWLPKSAILVERADGRERFAPGEATVQMPSRMAERKFGGGK